MVGGGTAGAALAARLAQLPGSVLLLEAGSDPPVESIVSTDQSYFIYFLLKSLHTYIRTYIHISLLPCISSPGSRFLISIIIMKIP